MNEIITSYPIFQANQVLTNKSLNDVVDYLDKETRYTRIHTIGMGIICGLEVRYEDKYIHISEGVGITSEGYLVRHEGGEFGFYKEGVTLQEIELRGVSQNNKENEQNADLASWTVAELDSSEGKSLDSTVEGKVVLLFFECRQNKNDLCGNDCDEQGTTQEFKIRFLLVDEEQADTIISSFDIKKDEENLSHPLLREIEVVFHGRTFPLEELTSIHRIRRFVDTSGDEVTANLFAKMTSKEEFLSEYRTAIRSLKNTKDGKLQLNTSLNSFFLPFTLSTDKDVSIELKIEDIQEAQYRYDHICDILETHNELLEVLSEIVAFCTPPSILFPKHLFLGQINVNHQNKGKIYRNAFLQPPSYNGTPNLIQEAKLLYKRLELLKDYFEFDQEKEIRITPSKSSRHPLGDRAIPFYYKNESVLSEYWNVKLSRRGLPHRQYTHQRLEHPRNKPDEPRSNAPYDKPLQYSFLDQDFLRIEGHIGKDRSAVINTLTNLRSKYNLAFDLVYLKLGETIDEEGFEFDREDLAAEKEEYLKLYSSCREKILENINEIENRVNKLSSIKDLHPITVDFAIVREKIPPEKITAEAENEESGKEVDQFEEFSKYYDLFIEQVKSLEESIERYNQESSEVLSNLPYFDVDHLLLGKNIAQDLKIYFKHYKDLARQITEIKSQHLFHNFASKHHGLEHKGGVPIGGTFVLVYISGNDTNTSGTVVADFYLPYSCCNTSPPLAYVVNNPPLHITVNPSIICEEKGLNVSLTPLELEGDVGGLLSGKGLSKKDGQYLFNPKKAEYIDVENKTIIENASFGVARLLYSFGTTETEVFIDVLEAPDANFSINDDVNYTVPFEVCQDDGSLLKLSPNNGEYSFSVEEGLEHEIEIDSDFNMDLATVKMEDRISTSVFVTRKVNKTISGNDLVCNGQSTREIVLKVKPNVAFVINKEASEGKEARYDTDFVCRNEPSKILLVPEEAGGNFSATIINNSEVDSEIIARIESTLILNNREVNLSAIGIDIVVPLELEITYRRTIGCGDRSTKPLRIVPAEQIFIFNPSIEKGSICSNETIDLIASHPDVQFFVEQMVKGEDNKKLDIIKNNQLNLPEIEFEEGQDKMDILIGAASKDASLCLEEAEKVQLSVFKLPQIIFGEPRILPLSESKEQFIIEVEFTASGTRDFGFRSSLPSQRIQKENNKLRALYNYKEVPVGSVVTITATLGDSHTGNPCELETSPVEIVVTPFITGFNFLATDVITVGKETEIIVNSIDEFTNIKEDIEIQKGDFFRHPLKPTEGLQFLSIQAKTLPKNVQQVLFLLEAPESSDSKEYTSTNGSVEHQLFNDVPPGFIPKLGKYRITATPFEDSNGSSVEGESMTISFEVIAEEDLDSILNRRRAKYSEQLKEFEDDGLVTENKMRLVSDLQSQEINKTISDLNNSLADAEGKIIGIIKNNINRGNEEKANAYIDLLALAIFIYLDRLIGLNHQEIAEETAAKIEELSKQVEPVNEIQLATIISNWKVEDFEKTKAKEIAIDYKTLFAG
ncbi:MAG: hypothetical protein AAGG68_10320 [Bacteroidota bacterium]